MKEESVVIKPAAINFIGTFAVSAIVLGVVTFLLLGLSKYIGFFLKGRKNFHPPASTLPAHVIRRIGNILKLKQYKARNQKRPG